MVTLDLKQTFETRLFCVALLSGFQYMAEKWQPLFRNNVFYLKKCGTAGKILYSYMKYQLKYKLIKMILKYIDLTSVLGRFTMCSRSPITWWTL